MENTFAVIYVVSQKAMGREISMRISNNHSIFIGENIKQQNQMKDEKHAGGNRTDFFAGSLNQDLFENKLFQKKKEAQEKALKVVGNAFAGDQEIDNDIQGRRDKIAALEQENQRLQDQINEISESQDALMKQYGMTADSQEQKDLELLRKRDKWLKGEGPGLTKEEFERTMELEREGLTDYQKRQREWDAEKSHFQKDIDKNKEEILIENAIIRGTRLERLKHAPMVKAQKEADAILDAAGKEIIGMIMEEAKDTIDAEMKEEQEKAEKLEEAKEEQEAFIEKQKEKREETEELLEDMPMKEMLHMGQLKDEIKQEIKNIVSEMKLVAEDIKGAMVDESV